MSLWAVLLTGLLAGGASCAAVQGGLLAGTLARRQGDGEVDDVLPVGSFLAGKLGSHVVLGAALGLLGDAVQISPRVRAVTQIIAGIVMVLLALDLFGVAAVRGLVPAPPKAWSRIVRGSGRFGGSLGPALLGIVTVLIPCGVTLSMMFLSIASGSPLAGAAIMASFVVGTAPLFAVIGYAARRTTAHLRGRLGVLSGVAVLVAGLLAINAGLVLSESRFTLTGAWRTVTGTSETSAVAAPPVAADGKQRIVIEAHDSGFSPASVTATAGVPTEVTFRTDNTRGCTRFVVSNALGLERSLPATGNTRIDVGALKPGTYRYTCGMGMYFGSIKVVA